MRVFLIALLATTGMYAANGPGSAPRREIDNVAAFARLYGVVRYFYPSDAAASLDWNHFAVHGVKQTRVALDVKGLKTTLEELFGPLGPGIEIGARLAPRAAVGNADTALIAWRYLGAGITESSSRAYAGKRTNRARTTNPSIDGYVTLMQTVPAGTLHGKTIRLRGKVRAAAQGASGSAALWLQVNRGERGMGFMDNMGNRPIREPQWGDYAIEATIAEDATSVALGVLALGVVVADFGAIDLTVQGADGNWTPTPIMDGGFEAAVDASSGGWIRAGSSSLAQITRPTGEAPEGRQFLRFTPPSVPTSGAELFEDAAPTTGTYVDVELGSGLKARVPLALTDAHARADATNRIRFDALSSAIAELAGPSERSDVDVRLADVVVAWNVFRHFYPYWPESGVDWDTRLRPQLEAAYRADTRNAEADALRLLVADARDGHGRVSDTLHREERAALPLQFGLIGDRVVVTATDVPSDAPVGAVVSTIDGVPASQRVAAAMRLRSGTTQWRRAGALQAMTTCPKGTAIRMVVDDGTGLR